MKIGLNVSIVLLYLRSITVDSADASGSYKNTNADVLEERIREALKVLLLSERRYNDLPTLNEDAVEGDLLDKQQQMAHAFLTTKRKRSWDWGDDTGNRATSGTTSAAPTTESTAPTSTTTTTTKTTTSIQTNKPTINWPNIKPPSWWRR